jgi:hypothetical protein
MQTAHVADGVNGRNNPQRRRYQCEHEAEPVNAQCQVDIRQQLAESQFDGLAVLETGHHRGHRQERGDGSCEAACFARIGILLAQLNTDDPGKRQKNGE